MMHMASWIDIQNMWQAVEECVEWLVYGVNFYHMINSKHFMQTVWYAVDSESIKLLLQCIWSLFGRMCDRQKKTWWMTSKGVILNGTYVVQYLLLGKQKSDGWSVDVLKGDM